MVYATRCASVAGVHMCEYIYEKYYNVEEARRQQRDYLAEKFFAFSLVDTSADVWCSM